MKFEFINTIRIDLMYAEHHCSHNSISYSHNFNFIIDIIRLGSQN